MKSLRGILTAFLFFCLTASAAPRNELRGAWIATVEGLDWPDKELNHFAQRSNLIKMIEQLAKTGCNTVFFQVVSEMDAMYSSDLLPWSRHLTGVEGISPYFDPLAIATLAAHEHGMKIHAWINPLRVSRSDTITRAPDCIKYIHPEWVKDFKGKEYLDPGNPEVARFLSEITSEIMERYDVDGLHIDDYFYPDGLQDDDSLWDDAVLYKEYGGGKSLKEWRFSNIDRVVKTLYETVHAVRPDAEFGVSPAGRIANTSRLYADPRRWARGGYVDYLIPQIYWSMDRGDFAAFPRVLKEWQGLGVDIYVGIAAYKHDPFYYRRKKEAGYRNFLEFKREIDLCRSAKGVYGHVWFRTQYILKDDFRRYIRNNIY